MTTTAPSPRTRLRRLNKRAHYDAATVHAILDAQPLCTVAYVVDGQPFATPTLQWREGHHIYWHGSSASRAMEKATAMPVCVSVFLLDGLVMARRAFNHSCNYRSVMAFGTAFKVTEREDKIARLKAFTEQLYPGRWDSLKPMTEADLKATTILGLDLSEASAKIRSGPPGDDAEDMDWPVWAGVIPTRLAVGSPVADQRTTPEMRPPQLGGFAA